MFHFQNEFFLTDNEQLPAAIILRSLLLRAMRSNRRTKRLAIGSRGVAGSTLDLLE